LPSIHRYAAVACLAAAVAPVRGDSPAQLGRDFFAWRHATRPITRDDVDRVERPPDWTPDVSPSALRKAREKLRDFERRLAALGGAVSGAAARVDFLLLRSAIARADFELDLVASPSRDPGFYVQQTAGAVLDALVRPPPITRDRIRQLLARLKAIPQALKHAETNLQAPVGPLADAALEDLRDIGARFDALAAGLRPEFPAASQDDLAAACGAAGRALQAYARWLEAARPRMKNDLAIGRAAYERLLHSVSLLPYSADDLVRIAEQEWSRAAAFESYEVERAKGTAAAEPPLPPTAEAQIEALRKDEAEVRDFVRERGIVDVPEWLGRYRNRALPPYLAPLAGLGVTDDLTSPSRRGEGAVRYIPQPAPVLPYFAAASARDPRPILVHEGIPGHFLQLSLSWAHPNLLRREYFDSAPIEGIAFYAEELLLAYGFFDARPRTRETIYRFARLRAARVLADVGLATGKLGIEAAARLLEERAPMDRATALEEARFFAASPGQAISYQIGKHQIFRFLADARVAQKDAFSLREFHNRLWREGNVPIALQRYELLGLEDEIAALEKQ
jgi:uncharacterized protein (DUF885 family)